jgi:hypothetical protein
MTTLTQQESRVLDQICNYCASHNSFEDEELLEELVSEEGADSTEEIATQLGVSCGGFFDSCRCPAIVAVRTRSHVLLDPRRP